MKLLIPRSGDWPRGGPVWAATAALVFIALALPTQAWAQDTLTRDDLVHLYPGASIDGLTPDELDQCLRNPQNLKLLALTHQAQAAQSLRDTTNSGASAAGTGPATSTGPTAPDSSKIPGFGDLTTMVAPWPSATPVSGPLTDDQLSVIFGPDVLAGMGPHRRDRWRQDRTLLSFYRAFSAGRMTLAKLRAMSANLLAGERAELVTRPEEPLRAQMPLVGPGFKLGLSLTTGLLYIERDRVAQQRDQQIANVFAALLDEDHESDIGQEISRISALDRGKKVNVILNLKMLYRGTIGTFGSLDVISLGLSNPWLSPAIPIRSLRGVIAHELGHLLQAKLYGYRPTVGIISKFVGMMHDPQVTTTGPLALSEGWGDYCGMSFGKSDYWDWSDSYRHQKGDASRPLKSRAEMLRTEGIVTRVLLLSQSKLDGFRDKVIASMGRHKPSNLAGLVDGYATDYPAQAEGLRAVLDGVLDGRP